jgi:RND family efflux transporter MFP subunit
MSRFLILISAALILTGCGGPQAAPPPKLTKVAALTLAPAPAVNTQEYPGLLTPLYKMNVNTNTGGIVEEIFVELGQTVKKGQALAKMESAVNTAHYNQAKAAYDLAKTSFDRQKALYQADVISRQAFETAESQFKQAEAACNVAKKNLEDCTLTAPRDGVVSFIHYDVGDNASSGSAVMVVADYSKVILRIGVVDHDIAKVRIGQSAAVHIDDLDRTYAGKVIGAGSLADDKTGAYPVRIEIDNSAGFIRPGMFGRAKLTLEYYAKAKVVPLDTLVLRGESKGLYELVSGNIARFTPVTINFEFEDKAYVQSPLDFGSRVVAKGQEFIVDGEEVEVVPED